MAPETKSRKPANTAFKQQRLKAWQPILTPKTVLPTFFIVGLIFAPLGGLLLYASNSVSEVVIDYTYCDSKATVYPIYEPIPSQYITSLPQSNSSTAPMWSREVVAPPEFNLTGLNIWRCRIQFTISSALKPPVFIYYRLTNFYQNHRRYVKSFDANQLSGVAVPLETLKGGSCKPMAESADNHAIYPCGLIANSIFNDTINVTFINPPGSPTNQSYEFSKKGIAWPSDKQKYGKTQYNIADIRPPPDWASRYPNGTYTQDYPPPDISQDESFQVWMRTAGLPDFRKLYGRNDTTVMEAGTYEISIDYEFPVTRYGGTKSVVISTVSFLGGKNPFLGIVYVASGALCVILGCLFTARNLYKPRKLGDHTYLSWNNNQGRAAPSN
ncbi:15980_t:CDS:2 [Acaulospora morrowiae]|uniref:15980_t:CDS:1 n=2 Tax=Diversisporales TaxID=214509 RepID=A0A9N9B566_9GLOM|nr:15980_t:CDS:2 [Acaulospora morrowiae]